MKLPATGRDTNIGNILAGNNYMHVIVLKPGFKYIYKCRIINLIKGNRLRLVPEIGNAKKRSLKAI